MPFSFFLSWHQDDNCRSELPRRPYIWMGWEESVSELIAGRKVPEGRKLRDLEIDGNRPRIGVFGFPVGCRFGLKGERDCFGRLIREKRLEKHLADIFSTEITERVTGERPYLVHQRSVGPLSMLQQSHNRRTAAPPTGSDGRVLRGRQDEHRARADCERARHRGREEERVRRVAQAEGWVPVDNERRLADKRRDYAEDHVPVFVQLEWNDRLHVEDELSQLERPDVLLPVELERHADQV